MIDFAIGFVAALVVIQFFPRVALVGAWIVAQGKRLFSSSSEE
jgi:hypothetical protein